MPMYSISPFAKTAVLAALSLVALGGCSSTERKPMHEPASYSAMSCSDLKAERTAVTHNESAERDDSSSAGLVQMMSLVTQGVAIGQGSTGSAMTLASAADSMQNSQNSSDANAEAYSTRSELLDKLLVVRHCQ